MTRIYTNVPAMIARTNLSRNMSALETSLERLSTGFKINSGKDDPAGLIASEMLRSDITGIKTAIKNTERANMMIATADSALNEVTNLLNDIRGLVTEAANTGAMSAEMIAANQLQVDASLDAIDRISAQTTFMGQKLLDGSLDFDLTGANRNDLQNLAVHQVTFGSDKAPIDVNINVRQAAEKAALYFNNPAIAENIVLQWGGNYGYSTQSFDRGATVDEIARSVNASSNSTGVIAEVGSDAIAGMLYTSSLGRDNDIIITAGLAGLNGGNVEVKYLKGTSEGVEIKYEEPIEAGAPAKITVYLQTEEYKDAIADDIDNTIWQQINANGVKTNDPRINDILTGLSVHDNNALKFEANIPGAQYNNANIYFVDGRFTQENFGDPSDRTAPSALNPYGLSGHPFTYYNDEATASKALFGDINGLDNFPGLTDGAYFAIQSKGKSSAYNNVAVRLISSSDIPAGKNVSVSYKSYDAQGNEVKTDDDLSIVRKELTVYYREDIATVKDVQDALKIEGRFELIAHDGDDGSGNVVPVLTQTLSSGESYDLNDPVNPRNPAGATSLQGYSNTGNSGGEAGTLFIVLPPDDSDPPVTAQDVVDMFDITKQASRGSERAANLFSVSKTVDNAGDGAMHLYDYIYLDSSGNPIEDPLTGDDLILTPKTDFAKSFKNGVTGGEPITTAAELVTALNNSAYWGMVMCPELIAELAGRNALGEYYDAMNPPVIKAQLAPGNHGLFAVSAYEEVAYYGNPNEGNAIQFLGEKNSPDIRFVAEPGNSQLWIDNTTVPDVIDKAQAVLTAQNGQASLIIDANKKGGEYDDVQFLIKRISEDPYDYINNPQTVDPNRQKGWVEYDPGKSRSEALATFKSQGGLDVANTAFTVTATERGDMFNNVAVTMKIGDEKIGDERVRVEFDSATKELRISLNPQWYLPPTDDQGDPITNPTDPGWYKQIDANDVIAAINNSGLGFSATRSYAQDTSSMMDLSQDPPVPLLDANGDPYPPAYNDGRGTFDKIGLTTAKPLSVANTGDTGGHLGGTVTVWVSDIESLDENGDTVWGKPTSHDVADLINADQVVSKLFTARPYTSSGNGKGEINFVKDGPLLTQGGLVRKGAITVHLVTDKNGLVQTTAKDLADWWQLQDPATVQNISASIVRPAGAQWDECNDPYGTGLLAPTVSLGECDEVIVNDIQFVGWDDKVEQQYYVSTRATGTMTSDNGIDSSYQMIARQYGPEWNGYTIVYVDDDKVTGHFDDNFFAGSDVNPCDEDDYKGLEVNDSGELITPQSTSTNGMSLTLDKVAKTITINLRAGITTANDVERLIESDPLTKNLFEITQLGDGTGVVGKEDDTLLTRDGALPPGELNGAKLLFGSDASDYFLIFKSLEYGSDQFVDVQATARNGGVTTFSLSDKNGNTMEKTYGQDVEALVNGVRAVGHGLNVNLNTATLSLDLTLSESAGTDTEYATKFAITGGGATYQVGPDVVSNQQITIGIQSVNTVKLGGASGKMYQLRSGQDASLTTDTNKAFRIVEESILSITSTRGRLGTMQKATFETNINVLNDTLDAITSAESQIRDTDFAEETSNLTRAQILVQSNMSTLGIANQIPNYMLSLIGR